MAKPKVSVIVPVYNTEKYLEEAFSSIQNQSLSDIEIIVINDGSTDRSAEIIDRLAKSDNRIHLFSQSNQGQSAARNLGMDNASGDYLYFMDSDDLLEADALEICYEKCTSQNLQMTIFDAEIFSEDYKAKKLTFNYYRAGEIKEGQVYDGAELLEILLGKNIFRAAPWLLFVKRELPEKMNLRFFPGIIHEDELFTPLLYLAAERVGYIPRRFFHRRIRANSTMTRKFSIRNVEGYFVAIEQLRLYSINKKLIINKIVNLLIRIIVNSIAYESHILSFRERISIFISFYQKDFMKFITIKNLTILLLPFTITIKTKFLRLIHIR